MKILAIGSCISQSIITGLKMEAVFEERRVIFDRLPWNFFDKSIEVKEFEGCHNSKDKKLKYLLGGVQKNEIEGADYLVLDLFSLLKPIIRIEYNGKNKLIAMYKASWPIVNDVEGMSYEEVQVDDKFIYESLEKFSDFLKEIYQTKQIIVIKPKITTNYLDDEFRIRKVTNEVTIERENQERKLHVYTDYFIDKLGSGILVYEIPQDVIGEHCETKVHYLQSDYIRIEDDILQLLDIDINQFWKKDLAPETLIYEYWIRKNDEYISLLNSIHSKLTRTECTNFLLWAIPTRMKSKFSDITKMALLLLSERGRKQEKKWVCFGAGDNCRSLLANYKLPIEFILDNDLTKVGSKINDIIIKKVDEVTDWSEYLILVTCTQTDEIERQLNGYGLQKEIDYILLKEFL